MTFFDALTLGIIQGITEFFPVSSSAHLMLAEMLLGLDHLEQYLTFSLLCHLGTLLAIFAVLRRDLREIVLGKDLKTLALLFLALLPLFLLFFFLQPIKKLYNSPQYVGFFLLGTALFLYLGERFSCPFPPSTSSRLPRWKDALVIGALQTLAIIPGISRSGSTISCAQFLGWNRQEAARFSFLMAIPTICGGIGLEGMKFLSTPSPATLPWTHYLIGFFASFFVGWVTLTLFLKLLQKVSFKPFACYCSLLGIFALGYANVYYKTST